MKQLIVPPFDAALVAVISQRLTAANATARWEANTGNYKRLKEDLTEKLLKEQDGRCAYCGCRLFGRPHRDHIAPKSPYYQWTYLPENLVLTCAPCNVDQKGSYDSVAIQGATYAATTFKFVHPYFDDPKQHIRFVGHRLEILISTVNSSPKGRETIELFDLTNVHRAKERAMHAVFRMDVEYLHGKWRRLLEQVALAPFPRKLVLSKIGAAPCI